MNTDRGLLEIVNADHPQGLRFGAAKGREQKGGEDGDNGDHHQQFDQSEAGFGVSAHLTLLDSAKSGDSRCHIFCKTTLCYWFAAWRWVTRFWNCWLFGSICAAS